MDSVKNLDFTVFRDVNVDLHSQYLNPFFELLSYSGLGITLSIAFLLLLISPKTRWLVGPLFATMILGGFILADVVFKPLLNRDRPSNMYFTNVAEPLYFSSFPSGHSCVSFGTAFIVLFLTWKTPSRSYGWLLLIWACLVGMSRMYRGVHWPSDVLAGSLVGLFSAAVVSLAYNQIEKRRHSA